MSAPLIAGQAQPLSMISADVDGDGIGDLVVGYSTPNGGTIAVYRGNLDAFAPQSDASFQAIGRGEFPSPFLPDAQTFSVPVRPDFLATGDFTGKGHVDLAVASSGGSTLYVFAGDGKGGFTSASTINLPGTVTAMAADQFGPYAQALIVGVTNGKQSFLGIYTLGAQGLAPVAAVPVGAAASNFLFGPFGENGQALAFLSGGSVSILRPSTMKVVTVNLPVTVSAFALGNFVFDRNGGSQIAVLASNGTVLIAARSEFDPRTYSAQEFRTIRSTRLAGQRPTLIPPTTFPSNGWKVIESFPSVSSLSAGQTPLFFRTRISSNGADDIMWLGAGNGQMVVISHPDAGLGSSTFVPGQVSVKPYNGSPIGGLPMRLNVDGRPGIVALHQGSTTPAVSLPIPDPTFFPNRFDDIAPRGTGVTCLNTTGVDASNDCTLREAIIKANATAGTDTIMLQAGTYTLTQGRAASPAYNAQTGTLNVNDSVNIVGAGQNSTIITWGTPTTTVDMVMAVNEDISIISAATANISNLTIQNGVNHGQHGIDGDGGCMEFDTGTNGTAVLTLTAVTLQNCSTLQGSGGGLANFNFVVATGTGQAIINGGSIIQNNSVGDNSGGSATAAGGGIMVFDPSRITMTGSTVQNNSAVQHTAANGIGFGGGLYIFSGGTVGETPQTQIHSSIISGNQSAEQGGGIFDVANLLIDTGTVISGNKNGQNGAGAANGGGLFVNPLSALSATLTSVTITGNTSTGTGGGIATGAGGAGPVILTFSRLAGNTAATTGNNLENLGSTLTATDDWWGTNSASSTIHTTGGTTTFDPFIVLTHTGVAQKIRINQSSTLTGTMNADNHGTAIPLANLTQIIGLPITFDNPVLGTIPQAQPETLNSNAQATATFNAGGTAGLGSADAVVDQATVGVNSNLIASATEAGSTATITTVGAHGYTAGEFVSISGVNVAGYNGNFFTVLTTPTATTFTYTAGSTGLGTGSGGTANAGIIILEPPSITKSFNPTTIQTTGGTGTNQKFSTVTFSITNGNVVPIIASFTDSLPANLVVATPPAVSNTCGGTVTATAGATVISFSNAAFPATGANPPCTITVNVSSAVDNTYSNSVTIDSTDAGNGNTSTASLTVINPPTSAKAFGAATIPLNGTTSMTITLSSTNVNLALNNISFTDTLPAGLVVATPSGVVSTCTGTATAVAGSGSVSLSGASLAAGTSCTVSLNVQGTTAGVKNNSVSASDATAGTGNTATASITVVAPPSIAKAFGAASIPLNGSTSLSFTINNPNSTVSVTGVAFSDTLPAGLVISTPNGLTGSCGGGTITATAGSGTISLSGATLAASASCTFSVNVTGTAAGQQTNTTGAVTSTNGGTGNTATASVAVEAPPSIAKVFTPSTIAVSATTSLTFTITNPAANVNPLTGVAFTDTLPTGLTVASGTSTVCGGTLTTTAPTGISLTGATIAVNSNCQFSVTVTGAVAGQYTNTTGAVTSTNGGTGNTASANLTVVSPATVTKSFGAATIPLNGTTSLTISITNPNAASTLSGISFTDTLPAGLVIAATPNLTNTCNGTATAVAGSGSLSLSGGTLAVSPASCSVSVSVQGTTAGVKNNSVTVTSTEGGASTPATASVTVVAPPSIAKAFGAASIPLNGSTSLSFTITNPNTTVAFTGVAFSDTLPAGLVVSTPNGLTGSCGSGTITATAGSGTISLSGGTIATSGSCTFSVNVTGTTAGQKTNTTGNVTSTEGGTGNTASASVAVEAPPSIAKVFTPSTIALNATTSLQFTITNPAANVNALTGVAFTDTLPTGLTVASGTSTVCGGTLTTTAPTGISLTGATIAVNSNCQFSVTVTGAASGQYTNTTGNVTSTNGGTGNTASANLTVASPATVTKAFGAASIPLNGTTSLTINISNPNTNVTLSGISFTDTLPAGLVIAATPNLTNTCNGTATAVAGSGSLSLSGGTLAVSPASCSVSVNVQGTTAGVKNNSVTVTSTEGGASTPATASITVVGPPTIVKAFGAASIPLNGSTSLSFTITNSSTVAQSGVAFSDTLPAGLVVSTPNGLTGSCGSGTITATQGTNVISLSGGTIASSGSCTFSVNVTGIAAGQQNNTTGNVSSTEGGTGNTASASVVVEAPPSIAKVFTPSTIALNATTSLQFTITNPAANVNALTGVAFTDTLPTGLTVASGTSTVCGGTLTTTAPTGISLSGATIAVNSNCQFSVTVTGAASGQYTNTTGNVTSTNGGTGNTASANLTVASSATIAKAFGAATIPLNGTTTLTFNLTNPNASVTLTGIAFTDAFPAGIVVASTPNPSNTCGGTFTTVAGAGSASLSGATLAPGASCTAALTIQGTTAGVKNNSVQVTSTEGGAGNTANASITVVGPPTLNKAFGAASIPLGGSTSLTFNIANPNTTSLSGIAFTDTLPAGLIISTPNGFTTTCTGTITATAGTNSISLSGGSLAASGSCSFAVNVTGTAAGQQNNNTGAITSTEGGTGGTASASVTVVAPPSIAKAFNPTGIPVNGTSTLTFTITNPSANAVAEAGVAFTDNLPAGVVVATPNGLANSCGGTPSATAASGTISLTGGTIGVNTNCTLSVNVTSSAAGVYTNTTGNVSSTNGGAGNTATATLTVAAPPTIAKAFAATSVAQNGTTSVSFTIVNPNTSVTLTGISFTDSLPAGLVVATPNGVTNNCGGTVTAVSGSSTITFTGGALDPAGPGPMAKRTTTRPGITNTSNAAGTCVVTVNLLVTGTGTISNTTGPVSANESGPGNPSNTATLEVVQAPTVNKAFGAASIPLNGTTSLTFNIANPNVSTPLVNITLGDTLPSGLVVATPNGLTGSCVALSSITANAGSGSISLTNLNLPATGSCSFSVNVTGTTAGTKNNTSGNISATFDDGTGTFRPITGGTASASLVVVAPPSIAKAFAPPTIAPNNVSTLSFTITNPAVNTVAESGVAFTDTLPAGIVVATPNNATGTCNGGTVTAVSGSGSISLTGGSIAAAGTCVISVDVTGSTPGAYVNTSGAVSSTNGGTGNTATATLNIKNAALSITKTHQGTFHRGMNGAQYFLTVSNSASAGPTVGTVTVVDTLPTQANPHNLVPVSLTGTGWTCTLATLTCTRSDVLAPGASYPVITFTVNIPQNIVNSFTNTATVSGGGDPNSHTASDPVTLGPPIIITSTDSGSDSVTSGNAAVFNFTVDTTAVNPQPPVVSFTCNGLPGGSACIFSPLATGQNVMPFTMTVTTLPHSSSLMPSLKRRGPLYATVLFPVFGVLVIGLGRLRNGKNWLRLALVLGLIITLLGLAGCGGAPRGIQTFTNTGTFNITVTGTANTPTGPVQGSATVTLTVQ